MTNAEQRQRGRQSALPVSFWGVSCTGGHLPLHLLRLQADLSWHAGMPPSAHPHYRHYNYVHTLLAVHTVHMFAVCCVYDCCAYDAHAMQILEMLKLAVPMTSLQQEMHVVLSAGPAASHRVVS